MFFLYHLPLPLVSRLTVQKEGPNKGRQFHVCPKPQSEQCGFFQWAGEGAGGGTSRGGSSRGRGGGGKVYKKI